MKKIISALMIAVCIGMAMPAQAQLIKFGVKGGVNLAKADFNKSDLKTDNFTGFRVRPIRSLWHLSLKYHKGTWIFGPLFRKRYFFLLACI